MASKSRRYGDGTVYPYMTDGGVRYRWQLNSPIDPTVPDGPSRRVTKAGFKKAKDAETSLQEAINAIKECKPVSETNKTVRQYSEIWFSGLSLANTTLQGYDKILRNHVYPHLGEVLMRHVVPSTIKKFYKDLEISGRRDSKNFGGPLSRNSINKVHIVLGAIFEQAVRDNLLKVNHFRRDPASINAPTGREIRAQKPEIATWTAEELNAFLQWNQNVHNDDLFELWALMAASGVRRSEAIALRWDDINFISGDMAVRRAADPAKSKAIKVTKTMTNRSVALDAQIISMLNSLRSRRGAAIGIQFVTGGSFIFPTLNNEMRNPNDVTARWSRTLAKAQRSIPELPHLTLKGLRHTNATHWLEAGVNPKIVQERLGHSNIAMTMDTYSHVSGNLQRNAVEQVKNWFSQSA